MEALEVLLERIGFLHYNQSLVANRWIFFTILFAACILGSVGIFIFAVGLETGNRIVNFTMKTLIEHATVVFVLFGIFNALVFWVYMKGRKNSRP